MMKASEFVKLQFQTLRKEIEESKARVFKLLVGGTTIPPVAQFLIERYDRQLYWVTYLLPLIVIAFILLFLAEEGAVGRCGRYICNHIEPLQEGVGWETWLDDQKEDRRYVDRYIMHCFYILSAVYYLSSIVAVAQVSSRWMSVTLVGIYAVVGPLAIGKLWLIHRSIPNPDADSSIRSALRMLYMKVKMHFKVGRVGIIPNQ